MRRLVKHTILALTGIIFCLPAYSQAEFTDDILSPDVLSQETPAMVLIGKIEFAGNKKTKEQVLMRELPFHVGDRIPSEILEERFELARQQLMNTALFHDVKVSGTESGKNEITVQITLNERWYLFPIPYFKYIDRNLNQWLVEQKGDLDRVNYGIKFLYNNFSGQNDKLNIWLMHGYTRQISAHYTRPFIDKQMKWGMSAGFATGQNREVNYKTHYNKQVFYKDEDRFIRSFLKVSAEAIHRPAIRTFHRFGISYSEEKLHDTVISLNPGYFKNGRDRIRFPEFYYTLNYYNVDYIPYPLEGSMAEVSLSKKGINNHLNLWQISAKRFQSWKLADRTWIGYKASMALKLPFRQPFFNQRMLGYQDFFMQGYEYFVIDGVAGGYMKTTLTREILNFHVNAFRKSQKYSLKVPFRIFAKAFVNTGYVHNPQAGVNSLNNTMLYSGGLGIDILTHYDFTLKLEWSFNQLGQNGLYLHRKSYY